MRRGHARGHRDQLRANQYQHLAFVGIVRMQAGEGAEEGNPRDAGRQRSLTFAALIRVARLRMRYSNGLKSRGHGASGSRAYWPAKRARSFSQVASRSSGTMRVSPTTV